MHHGSVKWFNNAQPMGFIVVRGFLMKDLFHSLSRSTVEGYKTLKAGHTGDI